MHPIRLATKTASPVAEVGHVRVARRTDEPAVETRGENCGGIHVADEEDAADVHDVERRSTCRRGIARWRLDIDCKPDPAQVVLHDSRPRQRRRRRVANVHDRLRRAEVPLGESARGREVWFGQAVDLCVLEARHRGWEVLVCRPRMGIARQLRGQPGPVDRVVHRASEPDVVLEEGAVVIEREARNGRSRCNVEQLWMPFRGGLVRRAAVHGAALDLERNRRERMGELIHDLGRVPRAVPWVVGVPAQHERR